MWFLIISLRSARWGEGEWCWETHWVLQLFTCCSHWGWLHNTQLHLPPPPHLTRHFIKNAECISHSGLLFSIRLRQYKLSVLWGCLHKCVVSILSLFGELIHFAVGFMYELKQNQTNPAKSELQNIFLRKLLTPSHCRVLLTSLHNGDKRHPALL